MKAADQTRPKDGAADHRVPQSALEDTAFIGELTLSGNLRPVTGVLPMVLAARTRGIRRVFVPEPQAQEAMMVPGMAVFGMRSLAQVVAELRGEDVPEAPPVEGTASARLLSWRGQDLRDEVDMSEVEGMQDVIFAVTVAAAGGHHIMLSGPRGAGKTTVAERIPTILPDLTLEQSLEVTAVHSLVGTLEALVTRPPFFQPHHDASRASILGGGTGRARPGEVSLAHHGVLFLDEFPLFRADVIDALRQPLEAGEVSIARGEESATYPARGMVVLAPTPVRAATSTPSPAVLRVTASRRSAATTSASSAARSSTGSTSGASSSRWRATVAVTGSRVGGAPRSCARWLPPRARARPSDTPGWASVSTRPCPARR